MRELFLILTLLSFTAFSETFRFDDDQVFCSSSKSQILCDYFSPSMCDGVLKKYLSAEYDEARQLENLESIYNEISELDKTSIKPYDLESKYPNAVRVMSDLPNRDKLDYEEQVDKASEKIFVEIQKFRVYLMNRYHDSFRHNIYKEAVESYRASDGLIDGVIGGISGLLSSDERKKLFDSYADVIAKKMDTEGRDIVWATHENLDKLGPNASWEKLRSIGGRSFRRDAPRRLLNNIQSCKELFPKVSYSCNELQKIKKDYQVVQPSFSPDILLSLFNMPKGRGIDISFENDCDTKSVADHDGIPRDGKNLGEVDTNPDFIQQRSTKESIRY